MFMNYEHFSPTKPRRRRWKKWKRGREEPYYRRIHSLHGTTSLRYNLTTAMLRLGLAYAEKMTNVVKLSIERTLHGYNE